MWDCARGVTATARSGDLSVVLVEKWRKKGKEVVDEGCLDEVVLAECRDRLGAKSALWRTIGCGDRGWLIQGWREVGRCVDWTICTEDFVFTSIDKSLCIDLQTVRFVFVESGLLAEGKKLRLPHVLLMFWGG